MQQVPGKHLQSHIWLGNSHVISRLLVPACKGEWQGPGELGCRNPRRWAQHPPCRHQHQPSLIHARHLSVLFNEEGERRIVKYEGILHCGAVCPEMHETTLKTQKRNTNKKYPPLKASNILSFNLSVFPLQCLIWKEKKTDIIKRDGLHYNLSFNSSD